MSISGITPVGRVSASTAETPTPSAPGRSVVPVPAEQPDDAIDPTRPLRFPWLSRLSLQLQGAANQRAAFAPAPVLGDNVDKSA